MPTSSVRVSELGDGRRCLALAGELDLANADSIVEVGAECLRRHDVAGLVIDLAAVTFMDSTALGSLIQLRNLALELDKQTSLAQIPPRIARLLEMTGLDQIFTVES
jgi:anti-sigma B factor antagonist